MSELLLQVKGLKKEYRQGSGRVQAVNDVSFSLSPGEILGVVGESGCGKSTLARCVIRLMDVDEGEILWQGRDIAPLGERELKTVRPHIQMIFQNPFASFNPRYSVGKALERVGKFYKMSPGDYQLRLSELLECCGISDGLLERRPAQLSGGQLQRLAIVRALLPSPRLLIADEAVSALDVSVQESILLLLREVSERYGLAVIFISHDLAVVKAICRRVMVMYKGCVVERGETSAVFHTPAHPYTRSLLSARPRLRPAEQGDGERILLRGDVNDAPAHGGGCLFAGRCYLTQTGECTRARPPLYELAEGHEAACYCMETPNNM